MSERRDDERNTGTNYASVGLSKGSAESDEETSIAVPKTPDKPKKKSLGDKIAEAFIATDGIDIKNYLLFDLLIPGVKRAVEDLVHMILFGDGKSSRIDRSKGTSKIKHVGYDSMYNKGSSEVVVVISDAPEIVLEFRTREAAEKRLLAVSNRIDDAGFATMKYLYSQCNLPTDFTQTKWGWYSTDGVKVTRSRDGYLLKMPKMEEI